MKSFNRQVHTVCSAHNGRECSWLTLYTLYPVQYAASGPSLTAPPNKLLAVHSILNTEAL